MRTVGARPCLLLMLAASAARATTGTSAADDSWQRSVALEREGDLRGAEAVLVAAWGKNPDNYYAQLRLAYLALLRQRANAAVARYQRARRFPEAEGDADAAAGYAAALALKGWRVADAGRTGEARVLWQKALAVNPEEPDARAGLERVDAPLVAPEVWGALAGQSFGSARYQGLVVFGQLPWRFLDQWTLRAAGRHIDWRPTSAPSPWALPGPGSAGWAVNELYGGAGYDTTRVTAEALGFAVTSTGSSTIMGAGARLRLGRLWGGFADLAALRTDGRWANEQLRPVAFLAVGRQLVLHAGARLTHEVGGVWGSGEAGAALLGGPLLVYLFGHVGTEHWAANLAGPSLLSIAPRTRSGGSLTLLWNASRLLRVAGQAEACTLAADGATGAFWSVALGLQLRIFAL